MRSTPLSLFGLVALAGCTGGFHEEHFLYRDPDPVVVERHAVPAVRVDAGVEEADPAFDERPPEEVVSTFDEDLNPYGDWVDVREYGRCWRPRGIAADWRPYTVGHWVYNDDCGWTWDSEEPYGYAVYHYGRWYEDARYGWVWVPGATWGPAWVAWRSGDGYLGWAPLPPRARFGAVVEITDRATRDIPPSHFCFVHERDIADRRIAPHLVNFRENTTIINRTTNVTHITRVNNVVVNRSVDVTRIERETGQRIERKPVRQVNNAAEARRLRQEGQVVAYRPARLAEVQRQREERRSAPQRTATPRANEDQRARRLDTGSKPADRPRAAEPDRNRVQENEPKRADQAQRARAADAERARSQAERTRADEVNRARAAEAERARAQENERTRQREAQPANRARTPRTLENNTNRATDAERAHSNSAERGRAADVERNRAQEAERSRAAAERSRANEAERARAAQNERTRAAESERSRASQQDRARTPESRQPAAGSREESPRRSPAAESNRRANDDR